ncbi:LLM class flavin-dependent oxidoreductase [Gordonia sp. DT219]|uniref:LLM class flavin-dependent oxidoreductase n=1 Tax=Gordonia sp. DT219 TaxID=3416658 RepID=UPI003CEC3266
MDDFEIAAAGPVGPTWDGVRAAMGRVGAFLPNIPFAAPVPAEQQRDAARRIEAAGYSTLWINEGVGGKDILVQAALLMSATDRAVLGTAVASMWARSPQTAHGGATQLVEAFGNRIVLGLGVGYPFQAAAVGREFGKPRTVATDYLDRMTEPVPISPATEVRYPRLLAANGPAMLEIAGALADGALPTLLPPAFTRRAREILGPEKLLVVGLSISVADDPRVAREKASSFAEQVLGQGDSPYARALTREGVALLDANGDLDERVLAEVVPHGGPDEILYTIETHLAAGADHVRLASVGGDFATGITELEALGPELTKPQRA